MTDLVEDLLGLCLGLGLLAFLVAVVARVVVIISKARPPKTPPGDGLRTDSPEAVALLPQETVDARSPTEVGSLEATLFLHLGAMVAWANGEAGEAQEHNLLKLIKKTLHLSEDETRRLADHLVWLRENKPGFAGLKKRLRAVDSGTKARIGQFVVTIAGADGHLETAELKLLLRVYQLLGLDSLILYRDIRDLGGSSQSRPAITSGPLTSSETRPVEATVAQQAGPRAGSEGGTPRFTLDMKRVKARIVETANVSKLLAEIFGRDETSGASPGGRPSISTRTPPRR